MMTFHSITDLSQEKLFNGATLILPSVSVGNVGQLACDLVISTLALRKVGYFCPQFFHPVAGCNPFAETNLDSQHELCLNSEVFHSTEKKLTAMQFRAPLIKTKVKEFCEQLTKWFKVCGFSQMVVLASCHAYERTDRQLSGSPFRYLLSPSNGNELRERFDHEMAWRELEERDVGFGDRRVFLPGAGFAKDLYSTCCEKSIPVALLMVFCSEGDNVPEANFLVTQLNRWQQMLSPGQRWKEPSSWKRLFGAPPPDAIF